MLAHRFREAVKRNYHLSRSLQQIELTTSRRGRVASQGLRATSSAEVSAIFANEARNAAFETWLSVYGRLQGRDPDKLRRILIHPRALFLLVSHFKPKAILEIGTLYGSSTFFLAAALQENAKEVEKKLTTIDIVDVNDAINSPWRRHGLSMSPQNAILAADIEIPISFYDQGSSGFFAKCEEHFDFVFIDGSHRAVDVYDDIRNTLQNMRPEGIVVLHDYHQKGQRADTQEMPIPGVYLAVQRALREAGNLAVLPADPVPWPNQRGRYETSLALLTAG